MLIIAIVFIMYALNHPEMMPTIGIMTIVSAALTIYLCHDEYKNGKMSSKNFKIVAICEGFAILGMIFLIIS